MVSLRGFLQYGIKSRQILLARRGSNGNSFFLGQLYIIAGFGYACFPVIGWLEG